MTGDPSIRAITARFEASRAAFRAARDEVQEQQAAQWGQLTQRNAGVRQDQAVWMRAFADAKAADQAAAQAEAEQQNRWPEREKRDRVLSFGAVDEQPAPPPPPPPAPRPAPKPPAPQPATSDRPSKGRVLNFSTEDDEDEGFQGFRRRR